MLTFISQLSFLKAFGGYIFLDVNGNEDIQFIIDNVLQPINVVPLHSRTDEFSQLTKVANSLILPGTSMSRRVTKTPLSIPDIEFAEGKRIRVQHLRIERSPLLRKFYIISHPEPVCNACEIHIKDKYPWVDYMLDSANLYIEKGICECGERI